MSDHPSKSDNLDHELGYLILVGVGIFATARLWMQVKPWVMGQLHQVQANLGRGLVLDAAGVRVTTADVVGVLVVLVPLLVVLLLLGNRLRRRPDRGIPER